jgi:SAM-dependent methyltransferase
MLLEAGASHVYAVEPSAGIDILRQNTAARSERVTCIKDVGENLPSDLNLDLVVSIGVLDHIPEPGPVVRAAYASLRPGGHLVAWIYGREGNETYLRFALPLRRVTTRLPHIVLKGLTYVGDVALDGYIGLCRFIKLPMRTYMREHLAKLPHLARRMTIYDQLNPAFAKYYTRQEAYELLASVGFNDVQLYHRHEYSWTVIGRKPEADSIPR